MSEIVPCFPFRSTNLQISAAWDRAVVPAAGGEATLLIRITPASPAAGSGQRRAPVDVAFVLDHSGSMAGEKLALVKEAVNVAVGHLRDEDQVALVVYDHEVETLQALATATPRVKTALRLALQGVDSNGSTNLSGGWLTGCDHLANSLDNSPATVRIRRSLLLTDGLANVGIVEPDALMKHAHELRRRGISTTTLGVGAGFDEALLSGMAEAGGGNFQYIAHAGELRGFFERELGELLTIAAAGLTLSLTLPHGVRARLVNAYPVERRGKRIDVALGDLPAADEVALIFTVTAAPGAPRTSHLATVQAEWADPAADQRRSFALALPPLVLADQATVDAAPLDREVAEHAAVQRSAAAEREAMRLDRLGRYAESRARLREGAAVLAAAPTTARVAALRLESSVYLAQADDAPLPDEMRKQSTYRSFRRQHGKADP